MATVTLAVQNNVLCVKAESLGTGRFVFDLSKRGPDYLAKMGEMLMRLLTGEHPANLGFTELKHPVMTYPQTFGFSTENFPL